MAELQTVGNGGDVDGVYPDCQARIVDYVGSLFAASMVDPGVAWEPGSDFPPGVSQDLSDGTVVYSYIQKGSVPVFYSSGDPAGVDKVNEAVGTTAEKLTEGYDYIYPYHYNYDGGMFEFSTAVIYFDGSHVGLISRYIGHPYNGGGFDSFEYHAYDLTSGDEIDPLSMIGVTQAEVEAAGKALNPADDWLSKNSSWDHPMVSQVGVYGQFCTNIATYPAPLMERTESGEWKTVSGDGEGIQVIYMVDQILPFMVPSSQVVSGSNSQ